MLALALQSYNFTFKPNPQNVGAVEYALAWRFGGVVVELRIALLDWQAPSSGLVILTMATRPERQRSQGYGGRALEALLAWARACDLAHEIRATQVSDPRAAQFWTRHGFEAVPGSVTGDYVRREPRP